MPEYWIIMKQDYSGVWSNDQGWVSAKSADVFTTQEKESFPHIPQGGVWKPESVVKERQNTIYEVFCQDDWWIVYRGCVLAFFYSDQVALESHDDVMNAIVNAIALTSDTKPKAIGVDAGELLSSYEDKGYDCEGDMLLAILDNAPGVLDTLPVLYPDATEPRR